MRRQSVPPSQETGRHRRAPEDRVAYREVFAGAAQRAVLLGAVRARRRHPDRTPAACRLGHREHHPPDEPDRRIRHRRRRGRHDRQLPDTGHRRGHVRNICSYSLNRGEATARSGADAGQAAHHAIGFRGRNPHSVRSWCCGSPRPRSSRHSTRPPGAGPSAWPSRACAPSRGSGSWPGCSACARRPCSR